MKYTLVLVSLAMLLAALAVRAEQPTTGTLTVSVTNASAKAGTAYIAVCTEKTYLTPHCEPRQRLPLAAAPAALATSFTLPPGRYAIQSFLDVNGNNDLDRNLIGLPKEPLGFGNNVGLTGGKPRFINSMVTVPAGGEASTSVILKDFL